ncbi:MAG: sensor histidine kinase [Fimbriimonadaceae bacterium]
MARIALKTVRAKLTLTTVCVMGAVLTALGFVVYFGAERTLLASVDTELKNRADGMAGPRGGPPGMPFGPGRGYRMFGNGPPPPPMPRNNSAGLRPIIVPVQSNGTLGSGPDAPYDLGAMARAKNRWAGYSDATVKDSPVRLYTRPQFQGGRVAAVIQVPYDTSDILRSLANLRMVLLTLVIPLGVLLGGLAGMFLVGSLIRPLREMRFKAEAMSANNLSDRLPVSGEDEFAGLAVTLNAMLGRLEAAFEQEQATLRQLEASIEQQRRFTADASHELKTPLAVIKANAGLVLHMEGSKADYRESVQSIDDAATRMNRLVADLLVLARADAGRLKQAFSRCSLGAIVSDAIRQLPESDGRIEASIPPDDVVVEGSAEELTRVFVNLIDNALRHSPSGSPVQVDVARRDNLASVSVKDAGPGIAPEHLEHLFDRFYRVDESRTSQAGGTGLGLAICKGVVQAHGGQISVSSMVGLGTTFTVLLPIAVPVSQCSAAEG